MAKINQIEATIDGEKKQFYLEDKDTAESLAALKLKVSTLDNTQTTQTETVQSLEESVKKLTNANTETEATLTDYDERITKAENSAESASSRYASLSVSVDSNTQKIADEVERAKAVEGERDQLTASDNETLVSAINWVQTRAEKAIENVGTLSDLTTSEKTDVVLAINELVRSIASIENPADTGSSAKMIPVYCWGDSLTEGVGGKIKQAENVFDYMAYSYPAWLSQSYNVVNLGARGEDVTAIMARQGANPVVVGGFTIPADRTPVEVGKVTKINEPATGTGLTATDGTIVKWHREVESPGVNPCTIAGVEGTLYRGVGTTYDNDSEYTYYFVRSASGTAVTVPTGTQVQTYAMNHYRNGVAVIWMGANGGWSSTADFCTKVQSMITYGKYDNYLILVMREGYDLATLKSKFTDDDGFCHVLYLPDMMAERGLMTAGISFSSVDTSSWTTTDKILLNAPVLCEYIDGQSGESAYSGLHFSAWGYKAIGKFVQEKMVALMEKIKSADDSQEDVPTDYDGGEDTFGTYVYNLLSARTLDGSSYIDTRQKLWSAYDQSWTIAVKFTLTEPDEPNPWMIISGTPDGASQNLFIRGSKSGGWQHVAIGSLTTDLYSKDSGADQKVYYISSGENVMVISRNVNKYNLMINSTEGYYGGQDWGDPKAESEWQTFDTTLIAGGRWNSDGTSTEMLTPVTIEKLVIYNEGFDKEKCAELYTSLL